MYKIMPLRTWSTCTRLDIVNVKAYIQIAKKVRILETILRQMMMLMIQIIRV